MDPLSAQFSWNSVYAFSENRVIDSRELEGLEAVNVITGEVGPISGKNVYPISILQKAGVNLQDKQAIINWGKTQFNIAVGTPSTPAPTAPANSAPIISNKPSNSCPRDNVPVNPVLTIHPKTPSTQQPIQTQSPCTNFSCSSSEPCPNCSRQNDLIISRYLNTGGSVLTQGRTQLQEAYDNLPEFNKVMISHPINQASALAIATVTTAAAAIEVAPFVMAEATAGLKAPGYMLAAKGLTEGLGQVATGGVENIDPLAIGTAMVSSPGFSLLTQSSTSWKPFQKQSQFQSIFSSGDNNKSLNSAGIDFGLGFGFGALGHKLGNIGDLKGTDKTIFSLTLGMPTDLTKNAIRKTIEKRTGN